MAWNVPLFNLSFTGAGAAAAPISGAAGTAKILSPIKAISENLVAVKGKPWAKQLPGQVFFKHPIRAGIAVAGVTMAATGIGSLWRSMKISRPFLDKGPVGGYGAGYISWSRKSGMPPNHLSTDNLSLSLHKMRHTTTM